MKKFIAIPMTVQNRLNSCTQTVSALNILLFALNAGYDELLLVEETEENAQSLAEMKSDILGRIVEATARRSQAIIDLAAAQADFAQYGEVDMTPDEIAEKEASDAVGDALANRDGFPTMLAAGNDYRWRKEVAGITVDGVGVRTDDRSKILIAGMFSLAQAEPKDNQRKFISTTGPIMITNLQAMKIGVAVGSHVQNCVDAFDQAAQDVELYETAAEFYAAIDDAYDAFSGEGVTSRHYIAFSEDGDAYQEEIS